MTKPRQPCPRCGKTGAVLKDGGMYPHRCDRAPGGYFPRRIEGDHAQARRERVFAKHYRRWIGGRLVEQIMANIPGESVSNRDERIAATVIQWLGSSVGWSLLGEALEEIRGGTR